MTRFPVAFCFLLVLSASAQLPSDVFSGQWTLDLDKWSFDVNTQPIRQTIQVEIQPKSAHFLIEGLDSHKKPIHIERELKFDAGERPAPGGKHGDTVTDRCVDSRNLESVIRNGGKVVRTIRYSVSPNGKTLTVTTSGTTPTGAPFGFADVYQRPKSERGKSPGKA